MKVAIIFADGTKQINFTPENDDERQALKLITVDDNISLAVKTGSMYDLNQGKNQPFSVDINHCRGEYLRAFDSENSIMLVLTPKTKTKQK